MSTTYCGSPAISSGGFNRKPPHHVSGEAQTQAANTWTGGVKLVPYGVYDVAANDGTTPTAGPPTPTGDGRSPGK